MLRNTCAKCGGLLDTLFDDARLAEYPKKALAKEVKSMWRFHMFLPVPRPSPLVTAGEGFTPLRRLRLYSKNVMAKDETRNPTGSFKDRGASLTVTRLHQSRVRNLVLASEGNAGCSFALYSQMAGINSHIFLPRQANPAKVRLSRVLGTRVTLVTGTIGDAAQHAAKSAKKTGAYNASSFVTPFRHDGKGTMALEICEQLGWHCPDFVVYPVGGGVGLIGMWKMFKTLRRIGWTHTTPRFVAAQPAGCAPVVEAFTRERGDVEEWRSPKTVAQGLKIPMPIAGRWILRTLRESNATAVKVTDREIRETMRKVAGKDGMIIEPSSATAFAAVHRIYENGIADKSDTVVVIATGSGLKSLEDFP